MHLSVDGSSDAVCEMMRIAALSFELGGLDMVLELVMVGGAWTLVQDIKFWERDDMYARWSR